MFKDDFKKILLLIAQLCRWNKSLDLPFSQFSQAGENGRELQKGEKYDWSQADDTYTLTTNNPVLEDDGEQWVVVVAVMKEVVLTLLLRYIHPPGKGGGRQNFRYLDGDVVR